MVFQDKIAFFSESPHTGKTDESFTNMRTEYAWYHALDATHYPISELHTLDENQFDFGVIIIPKGLDNYLNYPVINELKRTCKKTSFMQEGPSWYFQSLDIWKQMWFYEIMDSVDFILCHNDIDKEYYEGLLDKPTYINPTLMVEGSLVNSFPVKQDKVIIGGNFVRWYGGFNSYMTALNYDLPIWAPSMGRKKQDEDNLDGLNHLPYMDWKDWIYKLAEFKYAVHLIPNTIGGTFSLNCAYLGIPCIGNKHSNTQKLCFPELSVEPHDLIKSKELVLKLKEDDDFYNECSVNSYKNYMKYYSKEVYLEHMNKIFGSLK